ncbi:MAG: hypothetical protein LBL07_05745 [Tannerella sp.]|jgi:hypothetical protein|nr:hypothetical protein [Tannerella sp.]
MTLNTQKTPEGMIITIIIGFKEMQQRIKEESSHFALRKRDAEGNSLFEEYVLDEGHETRFRSLFYSAQGELEEYLSAYLKNLPAVSGLLETARSGGEDRIIQLPMPRSFNESLARPTGIKIEDFTEAYIMYRWLEMKDEPAAAKYLATAEKLKSEINANLNKRSQSIERKGKLW